MGTFQQHLQSGSYQNVFTELEGYAERVQMYNLKAWDLIELIRDIQPHFIQNQNWQISMQQVHITLRQLARLDPLYHFRNAARISEVLSSIIKRFQDFAKMYELPVQTRFRSKPSQSYRYAVATVKQLMSRQDMIEQFSTLTPEALHQAIQLFHRALDTLSPTDPFYQQLNSVSWRLQRIDYARLDVPDLTDDTDYVSPDPVYKGGFSDVHQGLIRGHTTRNVALKILRVLGKSASKRHRRFQGEVGLWHKLRHPNVLRFYGLCFTLHGLAMVSPFMFNGSAPSYLAGHPELGALPLLIGAAKGLEYLHTFSPTIVHGDLRGANILVSPTGEACLADFGLSRMREIDSTEPIILDTTIQNAGAARWMSPELMKPEGGELYEEEVSSSSGSDSGEERRRSVRDRHEGVTIHSDIWAFGMTIYELMSGRLPYFKHKINPTVVVAILYGELPARINSREMRSDWDEDLWTLMQETWSKVPDDRPFITTVIHRLCDAQETVSNRPLLAPPFSPSPSNVMETPMSFASAWSLSPTLPERSPLTNRDINSNNALNLTINSTKPKDRQPRNRDRSFAHHSPTIW